MRRAVEGWLAGLSARERRLVEVAAGATLAVVVGTAALALRDDLAGLAARVAAHERELQQVRRLAATVGAGSHADRDGAALLTRLEAATDAAALGDRVAAMTPSEAQVGDGRVTRLGLRVSGASLAETVRLLHVLEQDGAPLGVERLTLRKLVDDPHRFDLTLEITDDAP